MITWGGGGGGGAVTKKRLGIPALEASVVTKQEAKMI